MKERRRSIELLSPARDLETGRQAILHGADAVYIGPESFGARVSAGNSIDDIARLCDFAHPYRARVYATVNTLIYPNELKRVEQLIHRLYRAGVDALIVQDLGILRLDIPPIDLHASTQCDNRTPEQFRWLASLGFSQIVAARELSVEQLREICSALGGQAARLPLIEPERSGRRAGRRSAPNCPPSAKVEAFIHGALCVSYSGRCAMGQLMRGRSGNRGECPQMCRLPYDLVDSKGRPMAERRHWLSLKDLNATSKIADMINAGVSSLKIEGRLKDVNYVKNITAHYSQMINRLIEAGAVDVRRSSYGRSDTTFTPDVDRSFNRTYTTYMLSGNRPVSMASTLTPKSVGMEITDPASQLVPGDGVAWLKPDGTMGGANVNGIYPDGKIKFAPGAERPPKGATLWRSADIRWQRELQGNTATRQVAVDITMDETGITAQDERGVLVRLPLDLPVIEAQKPYNPEPVLSKLGGTIYRLRNFENRWPSDRFIQNSVLAQIRRDLVEAIDKAAAATYPYNYRRPETDYTPGKDINRANVANDLSQQVYREHGVTDCESAVEVSGAKHNQLLMECKYCILNEMGQCRKKGGKLTDDLYLQNGRDRFRLHFDCKNCRMLVYKP